MTNREQLVADLRKQGVDFKDEADTVSWTHGPWAISYIFKTDGSLEGTGIGNLNAVKKLDLPK